MSTHSTPLLYSYFRSSCSWRVRVGLAMKNIEYQTRAVNLLKSEQHAEDYTQLNALNQVPSLAINGLVLTQSLAILEYLDETFPGGKPILPKDVAKKATARKLSNMIACGIQPIQNLSVLKYVGDEKKMAWGKHWIEVGFKALESELRKSSGVYCVGDEVSMADICLVPQVFNAKRFDVDMSQYPVISAINERLVYLPEFKVSHPLRQPDCPEELKIKDDS